VNQKRNALQVMVQILELTRKGSRKTRLMYGSNTSFEQLRKYLEYMKAHGLMVEENDIFSITEKGREFVKAYRELEQILRDSRTEIHKPFIRNTP